MALDHPALVVSAISLGVVLRREWLDRPRITVSLNPMVEQDGQATLFAEATNHGRQPTSVGGIGAQWKVKEGSLPGPAEGELLFNDPWERKRVDSGDHVLVRWTPPEKLSCHVDTPVRGFAVYARNRRAWSEPDRLFRLFTIMGWKPTQTPPELLTSVDDPVAEPVASRWKVWLPRHTRRPIKVTVPPITAEEVAERVRHLLDEAQS